MECKGEGWKETQKDGGWPETLHRKLRMQLGSVVSTPNNVTSSSVTSRVPKQQKHFSESFPTKVAEHAENNVAKGAVGVAGARRGAAETRAVS